MAAITSNGTGGGDASVGASWNGGVAPGEGDTCQILNGDTITIDANWTVGADSATPAIDVLSGGTLNWDNGGSDILTLKGQLTVRAGGSLTLDGMGTVGNVLTIKTNYSASLAIGKYGVTLENQAAVDIDGYDRGDTWDTLVADANAGTAAITTTTDMSSDWQVGDTLVVGSMTQAGTAGAETRTIDSFDASNVINLAGGNFTYKHDAGVAVINLSSNIILTSYNASYPGYITTAEATAAANLSITWASFIDIGSTSWPKYALYWSAGVNSAGVLSFCSFKTSGTYAFYTNASGDVTISDCAGTAAGNYGMYAAQAVGNTVVFNAAQYAIYGSVSVTGCHVGNGGGIYISSAAGVLDNCRGYGNSTSAEIVITNADIAISDLYLDNCLVGISLAAALSSVPTITFGDVVGNTTDISHSSAGENIIEANTISLTVSITSASGTVRVYTNDGTGHRTWGYYGNHQRQSSVVRSGTYAMLIYPTNADNPHIITTTTPMKSGEQVAVTAYLRKNGSYGAGNLPFIRISGPGVTTTTDTMADTDNIWQLLSIAATPAYDGVATLEIVVQSAGAGAAVYMDDVKMIYTSIDTGTMQFWERGDIAPMMLSTGLGAIDVWSATLVQIEALPSTTIGKLAVKALKAMRRII